MNVTNHKNIVALGVSVFLLVCVGARFQVTAADKVAARTVMHTGAHNSSIVSNKVSKVKIPPSVFNDAPERKDPFFPNAKYRESDERPTTVADGGGAILNRLKLTGFGGIGNKRWAMINGVSIYEGESSKIRVGSALYEVVCLEMKEQSVTVGLKDDLARRELELDK